MLRFKVDTEINRTDVAADSEQMNNVYAIAIVTEGSCEELEYLNHIRRQCEKASPASIVKIHFLNEMYADQLSAVGHSHPKHRLQAMLNWIEYSRQFSLAGDDRWLVCDRDEQNFHADKYDQLLARCKENDITLIVSNPAFQLWLLLHFTTDIDALGLDACHSCKAMIAVVERALRSHVTGYRHGHVDVSQFAPHVEAAISASEPYCHEPEVLRDVVGTNFASLLKSLKAVCHVTTF